MLKEHPRIDSLQNKKEPAKVPEHDLGVLLVPIAHNEFQARWSLSEETLESGLRAASAVSDEARLVLRVYSLTKDTKNSDFSNFWQDHRIDGRVNIAHFIFNAPAEKITAAIGLINKSGRFSPLARAQAITLPLAAAPTPAPTAPRHTQIPASGEESPPEAALRHKSS